MNISEMHVWFRQYAQQMGMQNVRAILPEQIDLVINTSINDVTNKIIAENISSTNDRTPSDNSKIGQINALRTLYYVVRLGQSDVTVFKQELNRHKNAPYSVDLDKVNFNDVEPLYFVDFAISYYTDERTIASNETKLFPIRLIDRAYLADTLQDYILSPRFRTPVAVIANKYYKSESTLLKNRLDVYTGENELHSELTKHMTIANLECTFIKKPAVVKYVSDINGDNVDCDLPDSLHYDILKHAVDLYRISIAGSIAAAQEQAQNQARENLRNNVREQ